MKSPQIHALVSILILLSICLATNWIYPCVEAYRSIHQAGQLTEWEDEENELSGTSVSAGGWPLKFYVSQNYDSLPSVASFSWINLGANGLAWLVAIAALVAYELRLAGFLASAASTNKRRISVLDLLVVTSLVAAIIAYWRHLESVSATESTLSNQIVAEGGEAIHTVILPKPIAAILPSSLCSRIRRVSEVSLTKPETSLVTKALQFPYITKLSISGGSYDTKVLEKLKSKPLLTKLQISGRSMDASSVGVIASLDQLQSLNLMRTNVTAQAVRAFDRLHRLQALNVIHTDVQGAELGELDLAKRIRVLSLPRPPSGKGDRIELSNWSELRRLICNEYDEHLNSIPVSLSISNSPKLESISLDSLQRFELKLSKLPVLSKIVPLSSQWEMRVLKEIQIGPSLALSKIELAELPKLGELNVCAADFEDLQIASDMRLHLHLDALHFGTAPKLQDTEPGAQIDFRSSPAMAGMPLEKRQKWIESVASSEGVERVSFNWLDLDGVKLAPLAKNTTIRTLDLTRCGIVDAQLLQLKGMAELETLILGESPINGNTIAWLDKNLPKLRSLKCEPLGVHRLKIEDSAKLEQVYGDYEEPYLPIDALKITNMPKLKDSFKLPQLIFLSIENAPAVTGLSTQAPWPKNGLVKGVHDLKFFIAGGPNLNDSVIEEILACTDIESLTIAYSSVTPAVLSKLGKLTKLKYLALSGSKVDDTVMESLSSLEGLTTLLLDDTAITEKSMDIIAQFKNLSHLGLNNVALTEVGMAKLSSLAKLSRVDCGGQQVTVGLLNALSRIPSLRRLDLPGSQLDSSMIACLKAAPALALLNLDEGMVDGTSLIALSRERLGLKFSLTNTEVDPRALETLGRQDRVLPPADDPFTTQAMLMQGALPANLANVNGAGGVPGTPTNQRTGNMAVEDMQAESEIDPRVFAPVATVPDDNLKPQ